MISDFHELSEKISRLAELVKELRRENIDLRRNVAALVVENADLSKRMQEAHGRISALLDRMPVDEQNEEAA